VAPDSSDFFGAGLRFIGSVLNLLTQQRSSVTVWTSEDISTQSMALMPEGPVLTAASPSMQQRVHDEIAALKQIDPDFNELQFLAQVTGLYQTYLSCDADMNADGMTAFATPALVGGYRTCVTKWKNAGLRRVVHDMKIVGSTIIKVSLDGTRQAIIVRFLSSGVRFTQDIDTRIATDGSAQSDSFTEFATFVRPAGTSTAKSAAAGGASHCPSCGAPSTAGAATCAFCGTNITGTGGTWLLDKTSESAYT
jgi:predicted lipid-binding transport protein (Tim44 family)